MLLEVQPLVTFLGTRGSLAWSATRVVILVFEGNKIFYLNLFLLFINIFAAEICAIRMTHCAVCVMRIQCIAHTLD